MVLNFCPLYAVCDQVGQEVKGSGARLGWFMKTRNLMRTIPTTMKLLR